MDILGIGVPELFFILLIALIVLGPNDMQKAGKTVGTWLRKIVMSDEWRGIKDASRKLKTLPTQLMREAGDIAPELSSVDEFRNKNLKESLLKSDFGTWGGTSSSDHKIAPPTHTQNETLVDEPPAPAQKADVHPQNATHNSSPIESSNA